MREHMGLFRGKRLDNGEWIEGSLWVLGERTLICKRGLMARWHEVDPDSIGECTSLRDKNGKLIFEGDILQREGYGKSGVVHTAKYHEIYGMWYVESKLRGQESMSLLAPTCDFYEIIGTIHDKEVCDESK